MKHEFKVGDPVIIPVNGVVVHGVVESIQLKKNLVDVKIYEPGHRSHCLIVAVVPENVEAEPNIDEILIANQESFGDDEQEEKEKHPRKHAKGDSA